MLWPIYYTYAALLLKFYCQFCSSTSTPRPWFRMNDGRVTLTFTGPAWSRTRSAINYCMDSLAPRVLKLGIVQGVYTVLILPWKCLTKCCFTWSNRSKLIAPAPRGHGASWGFPRSKMFGVPPELTSRSLRQVAAPSDLSTSKGPALCGKRFPNHCAVPDWICTWIGAFSILDPISFFVTVTILFFRVTISYMVFCHCGSAHSDYTVFIGAVMSRYSVT